MLKFAVAALVVLSSVSVTRADDFAEFNSYVESCVAEHGTTDKLVAACLDTQIGSKENYLSDLLNESEGNMAADSVAAFRKAQAAWEGYRDASCAYHGGLKPRDAAPRELLCRLRLVNARIEEILAGEDFAAFDD